MQLASLINSALPQRMDELAGALRAWSKGQMLDATVLRAGNGQALLQVAGQQVLAQTRMPLMVGQTLRLQVDKAGTQPQLRVLTGSADGAVSRSANGGSNAALLQVVKHDAAPARPVAASAAHGAGVTNTSNEALAAAVLRSALPQRQSLPQSMRALEQFVATPRPAHAHPALDKARTMVSDLLQGLPRPEDAADANRLRDMVQRSGLFHEAELRQQQRHTQQSFADPTRSSTPRHSPTADMKAQLMKAAESLTSAMRSGAHIDPGSEQAVAALRGAVSNIEANQVASVRGNEQNVAHNNAPSASWRIDLPFAGAHGYQVLQFRVDREPRGRPDADAQPSWIAQLHIQPPGGASLHVRIALNGGTVYTTFSTGDDALSRQLEQGEPQLRQLLDVVHLALGGMRCEHADIGALSREMPAGTALVSENA